MKNKKISTSNLIFIVIFMLMLILPTVFMNFKKGQTSDIDNKNLTEWPGFAMNRDNITEMENYFDDRVGFRSQAISLYTKASDKIFNVMVHPLFMYGKDGHIFYKDKDYIAAYQRLNTDEEYMDSFVNYLEKTNDYLESKNIKFLYFLCPDKKSIYPEFFPDSIHVKEDNDTVLNYMESKLADSDIEYVIPYNELLEAKKDTVVYNQKYDATHWNEFGSFLAQSMLDEHVQNWFDNVAPLSADSYTLNYEDRFTLDQSEFPIDEKVPVYSLITDTSQDATEYLEPFIELETTNFYKHYLNPNVENDRKLLIFTDSYFATYGKYYNNRFKEVYYVHRQNYEYLQYIVNIVFPDAVVFETAERSLSGEMPITADFTDYFYESPYTGDTTVTNESISYTITGSKGVTVNGDKILINPEGGDNLVTISGILDDYDMTKDYNLYLVIDGNYLELDYDYLHKSSLEDGLKKFEINIQRRYVAPSEVNVIAVNEATNEEYLIQTFNICYEE